MDESDFMKMFEGGDYEDLVEAFRPLYTMFRAMIEAGFNEQQAMQLVQLTIQNAREQEDG